MAQTGDVVLFQGATGLLDRLIRWFTRSPYTHVGVVIRDPPGLAPGPHLIESSLEPTKDEISGRYVFGVQVHPLSSVLTAHGRPSIRRLRLDSPRDLTQALSKAEARVDGRPYDVSVGDWLRAELRVLDPKLIWEQRDSAFWCSALVAYLYVKLGLLPDSLPWTLVSPKEWGPRGLLNSAFIGCSLAPPQALDPPRPQIEIPRGPGTVMPLPAPRARDAKPLFEEGSLPRASGEPEAA
jgi:hypothetical protein